MRLAQVASLTTLVGLVASCTFIPAGPKPLVSKVVGPAGAHMQAPGIAIDIPAGALTEAHTISIYQAAAPMDGSTPLSAAFRFEPAGLQFTQPISVHVDVPAGANGLVWWSKLNDETSFEFAGFIDNGTVDARNTHFSTVVGKPNSPNDADGCPDLQKGDSLCENSAAPPKQDCRQLCHCVAPDPQMLLSNTRLCGYNPMTRTDSCPPDSTLPAAATEREYLDGHDGDACNGWGWVPTIVYLCNCRDTTVPTGPTTTTSTILCPIPEVLVNGAWECHSTTSPLVSIAGAPLGPPPKTPVPSECVSGDPDRTKCDFNWGAYSGKSTTDTTGCSGHEEYVYNTDIHDQALSGHLENCQAVPINYTWQPLSGVVADCHTFDKTPDFPDNRSADDLQRCLLTSTQWATLQTRRKDCGQIPRAPEAVERATAPVDKDGGPIFTTLAILSVPGESAYPPAYPELTGLSSDSRSFRMRPMCPAEVPITQSWQGIGISYESASPPTVSGKPGQLNTNETLTHAEGNALIQLAEQRMRMARVYDGTAMSDWGATGGRVGGCGEMLVDRPPCSRACAPEGIYNARDTAGLDALIVRSPAGCVLFKKLGPIAGEPCADTTTCNSL